MIPSAPWSRGDAEREAKALFGNQALHRPAAAMAGCHERALDYIRQAPVIVLSANAGQTGRTAAARARAYAGPPMRMLCERGAKLREVMSFYGCAFQLRALAPSVLHPKRWPVVYHLGRLPPSTLAQIIPAARTQQDTWLRALTVWAEHCEYRCGNAWFQFDWVASAAREVRRGHEGVLETIADLAMAASGTVNVTGFRGNRLGQVAGVQGAVFDTRWTLAQAEAAAERWHRALGRAVAEQRAAHGLGVKFSEAMDYAPFTNAPVAVEGFDFVPLRSCEDLWAEGAAMRHCVGTYSAAVVTGASRIFSIQQAGRRIATLELARRPGEEALHRVVQLKGPCNGRPPAAVSKAAEAFYAAERGRIRGASGLRAAFPGITATFSEERA